MLFESRFSGMTENQRAFMWMMLQLNMVRRDRTVAMKAMSVSNALGWDWDADKIEMMVRVLAESGRLYNVEGQGTNLSFQISRLVAC